MAKKKNKEVETSERLKYAKNFKELSEYKIALLPSRYDDVYSTDFYSVELWDFLSKQQSKKPIDAIADVHNRIKTLSREQLEIECLMLARFKMASLFDYVSAQIAHDADMVDTGKLNNKLSKITDGYKKTERHEAKMDFINQAKGVDINPKNRNGIMSLDFAGEFLPEYETGTLFRWYKEANPEFVAKRGGDNRKNNK